MTSIKYWLIVLILSFHVISVAQYNIKVEFPSVAEKELVLANYYLGKIYAKDTVKLDANGQGVFLGDSLLAQGMYKIFLDEGNNFDLLIGADQEFVIRGTGFNPGDLDIKGSSEVAGFFDYLVFLKNLQNRGAEIRERIKDASQEEKQALQTEMSGLTARLHSKWEEVNKNYPGTFLAKFVKANYVPTIDISMLPEEVQNNDSLLLRKRFYFQREHFWDNFDYTDVRFLYTPFYKPKLDTWFKKVLFQSYDSIKPYVFDFIEEVKPNKRIFQFVTSWFLNSSINSNVMGMDGLFVDLARRYYLSGEAFWASDESMEKIKENVLFAENNLIGMTAPDLNLENVDGEYVDLHQVESTVTVVLIYEPNCSHCKVFVPEFYSEVYQKYKDKGLQVYAIYSMDDKQEWIDFLTKHDLYDWINVWDEHHVSRFKILYDARKTPGVYVLDENKKIVAKRMSVKQLKEYMENIID